VDSGQVAHQVSYPTVCNQKIATITHTPERSIDEENLHDTKFALGIIFHEDWGQFLASRWDYLFDAT